MWLALSRVPSKATNIQQRQIRIHNREMCIFRDSDAEVRLQMASTQHFTVLSPSLSPQPKFIKEFHENRLLQNYSCTGTRCECCLCTRHPINLSTISINFVFLSSSATPVFYFYVILSHRWIVSVTCYLSARQKCLHLLIRALVQDLFHNIEKQ